MATTALQTYGVPGRTRTFTAKAEAVVPPEAETKMGRVLLVQAEERALIVPHEDRIIWIE